MGSKCLVRQEVFDAQGWRQFEGHIPADERSNLVAAYHKRLTSTDTAVRDAAVSLHFFFNICSVQTWQLLLAKLLLSSPCLRVG